MFVEANPQFKNVTVYDANMKMMAKELLEQLKAPVDKTYKAVNENIADDKKKEIKHAVKPEKEKLEKKNDKSLLPKKSESKKKGLGVS